MSTIITLNDYIYAEISVRNIQKSINFLAYTKVDIYDQGYAYEIPSSLSLNINRGRRDEMKSPYRDQHDEWTMTRKKKNTTRLV